MLITVDEFCSRVSVDIKALIEDLQEVTRRYGDEEANAWKSSFPKLASVLDVDSLKGAHLYIHNSGQLELEYQLPSSDINGRRHLTRYEEVANCESVRDISCLASNAANSLRPYSHALLVGQPKPNLPP